MICKSNYNSCLNFNHFNRDILPNKAFFFLKLEIYKAPRNSFHNLKWEIQLEPVKTEYFGGDSNFKF